jgi:hypothetical protein
VPFVLVTGTHKLRESKLHSFHPDQRHSFNVTVKTAQLDVLAQSLPQQKTTLLFGKKLSVVIFHLAIAIVSKDKSTV